MANQTYLIDHWSYSSMKDFSANRYKFFLTYVLKTWTFKYSVAALVGRAAHKAVERVLKGGEVEEAIRAGFAFIENISDEEVKWGKTGTREDALRMYTAAINAYISELPVVHETLAVEEGITEFIKVKEGMDMGQEFDFAIPAKGFIDQIERTESGELVIHDHKFVSAYTDPEQEKPMLILQSLFYFHLVAVKYKKEPAKIIFHECKVSKNRNGEPQVQDWSIDYQKMAIEQPAYFSAFYRLYDACSVEISKEDCIFLPNIADMFDGEETFKLFAGETFGIDRPKAVKHKLEEAEIKDSRFVPSAPDKVENRYVTEEEKVRMKLQEFGLAVEMGETHTGHSVILYTLKPSRGRRMSEFDKVAADLSLALHAKSVRIQAPIPGTGLVGVEVPNPNRTFMPLPDVIEGATGFNIPIGIDVYGKAIFQDLTDAPHMLVAGATGSGKSVFLNVLLTSLIRQNTPDQMRLVLIDPKRVELAQFKDAPHLMAKTIYEVPEAITTLSWLVSEMEGRYVDLEKIGTRNISEYNERMPTMPRIVVVIDEFADLMLQTKVTKAKGEPNIAEAAIVRLAQKARAVGIHLVLGTQRPSVDVVTGLIKANIPTRVAFATSQEIDSRIILDQSGAEALLGKGDMLFLDPARRDLQRLQSYFV